MDRTARYAALNAKVKSLEGKLLKDEDYIKLLSEENVAGVAGYLKQHTHYKNLLESINEKELHRGTLENILKQAHVDGLRKILYFLHDDYKEFYKTLLIKYEIEELKVILRGIKTGRDNARESDSFIYIGKYSDIKMDVLLSSKNINDFINNLRGTVYYKYLRPLVDTKNEDNLFSIVMILDLAYFDIFYKTLETIDNADRKLVEDIQGTTVDLLNLQWIYRGLKFYCLPPEELFNYTIAYGCEFTRYDIKELCYIKDLNEFQKKILGTKYSFLFDHENTRDIFMERRILRYMYFYIKKLKVRQGMNISQSIIYNLFLEYEIRDIISVIEGIRYEMPAEEAKKFLIRKL